MKTSHHETPKPPQQELHHVTHPEHFSLPQSSEIMRGSDPWQHLQIEAGTRPEGLKGAVLKLEDISEGETVGASKYFVVSGEFTARRMGMRVTETGERDFMSKETFEATRKTPFGKRKRVSTPVFEYEDMVAVDVYNKEGQLTDIRTLSRAEFGQKVQQHFAFKGSSPARITELGWLEGYGEKPLTGTENIAIPVDQAPHTPAFKTILETQEQHGLPSLRGLTYFSRAKGVQFEVIRDEVVSAHSQKVGKGVSPWEPERRVVVRAYDPADPTRTVSREALSMDEFEKRIAALDTPNNELQTHRDRVQANFHFIAEKPTVERFVDRNILGQLETRLREQARDDIARVTKGSERIGDSEPMNDDTAVAAWMLSELPYTSNGVNTEEEVVAAEQSLERIITSPEGGLLTQSLVDLMSRYPTARIFDTAMLLDQELKVQLGKYGIDPSPNGNARGIIEFMARERYFEQNPEHGTGVGVTSEIGTIFEPTKQGREAQLALVDYLFAQQFANQAIKIDSAPQEAPEHVGNDGAGKVFERVIREKPVYSLRPDVVQLIQKSIRETSVRTLEKFCYGDPSQYPDTEEMVALGKKLRRAVGAAR